MGDGYRLCLLRALSPCLVRSTRLYSMNRTALILSAVALSTVAPAPANAAILGGTVNHLSPDDGYDADLLVRCDDGETRRVPEGRSSDDGICEDEDVDAIYVRSGEEWWTPGRRGSWVKSYDSTGWHDWPGAANDSFTVRAD